MSVGDMGNSIHYSSLGFNYPVIKITSDDGTEVKGEFSGTIYEGDITKKMTITEGSFYAKW